jgi:integrase
VRRKVGASKKLAETVLHDVEVKKVKGEFLGVVATRQVLFEKLCDMYLDYAVANKAPHSIRRDRISTKNLRTAFTGRPISTVGARDLEVYLATRRQTVEPATVNRELSCIKHMFRKAVEWGYLGADPFKTVRKFREPPGRIRYLTQDEIDRLLVCCSRHVRPMVIMALNTGMRIGEILSLQWNDIDLKTGVIAVRHSKNNESRMVPINDALHEALMALEPGMGDSHVFTHLNGEPYHFIYDGFRAALKRARIDNFRFHDLRHTFASHLVMQGVDIRTVGQLLGHKTIAMTMRYSHVSDERLKDAVHRLNLTEPSRTRSGTGLAPAPVAAKSSPEVLK